MYYEGHNKIAVGSQEAIFKALVSLMDEKPYMSISVSEICKDADVSRQTFYSLFKVRENVILFGISQRYCLEFQGNDYALTSAFARYIDHNKHFLTLLVENDIIYLLDDSLYQVLLSCDCLLHERSLALRDYTARYLSGGMTGVVKSYVHQGCRQSVQDIERVLTHLIGPLI